MNCLRRPMLVALAAALVAMRASAAEPVVVFAAGSLRAALTDVGQAFEQATGTPARFEFGPSGLLKQRILAGETPDVFASANTEHPQALVDAGRAAPVVVFARNQLCALVRPGLDTSPERLLDTMLDPAIKLGTSTPGADPSGDYAWQAFRKADSLRSGSFARLDHKALKLTGGSQPAPSSTAGSVYGALVGSGRADVFLTYRTNALLARKELPALQVVDLPAALAVGAEYGVTHLQGASPAARRFVEFLAESTGQGIRAAFGFR